MLQWLFDKPKPEKPYVKLLRGLGLSNLNEDDIETVFQQAKDKFPDLSSEEFEYDLVERAYYQNFVNGYNAEHTSQGAEENRTSANAGKVLATRYLLEDMLLYRSKYPQNVFDDFLSQEWPEDYEVLCKQRAGDPGCHRDYKECMAMFENTSPCELSYCIVKNNGQFTMGNSDSAPARTVSEHTVSEHFVWLSDEKGGEEGTNSKEYLLDEDLGEVYHAIKVVANDSKALRKDSTTTKWTFKWVDQPNNQVGRIHIDEEFCDNVTMESSFSLERSVMIAKGEEMRYDMD